MIEERPPPAAPHTPSDDPRVDILVGAADAAAAERTLDESVRAAWSALHRDRDLIGPVFAAWNRHERGADTGEHPSGLGEVLRRRYSTSADIARSLRGASEAQAS